MSDDQNSEREAHIKAADDPEVEGHAHLKAHVKATDDAELDDEPDVEGHMLTKAVQKKFEK